MSATQEVFGFLKDLVLNVTDVEDVIETELGGKTATPPMDIPDGPSIAHFIDPAGNMVGLVKEM